MERMLAKLGPAGSLQTMTQQQFVQQENLPSAEIFSKFARIPWLQRHPGGEFKHTEMYMKILKSSSGVIDTNLKCRLFSALNEMFPRYLASRYHTMDCKSLSKSNPEFFWNNATFFLCCNQVMGPLLYHHLLDMAHHLEPELSLISFSEENAKYLLTIPEDKLDECSTAEEFLLEPWVLVQLPFQPVLLYQWSVAVLAEALKLQKELVDFYVMLHPAKYAGAISKLLSVDQELFQFATVCLCIFGVTHAKDPLAHLQKGNTFFLRECFKILPALRFVLSRECRNVVRALKRLCWNRDSKAEDQTFVCEDYFYFERHNVFLNKWFWEGPELKNFLVKTDLRTENGDSPSQLIKSFSNARLKRNVTPLRKIMSIKNLIMDKIFNSGRVKGVPKDVIIEITNTISPNLTCFYDMYLKYQGTSSEFGSSSQRDGGIILDIVNLQSDAKVAEALALVTMAIMRAVSGLPGAYVDAIGCKGPEMTLEAITEALKAAQPSQEWSYESILGRLKSSNSRPTEPYDRSRKTTKIVEHFEARVKSLVVCMLDQQFQSLSATFKYQAEQQFVQYVLPCMVGTILVLEKDRAISRSRLMNFADFVHHLICAYEKKQYALEAPWSPARSMYLSLKHDFVSLQNILDTDLRSTLREQFLFSPIIEVLLRNVCVSENGRAYDPSLYGGFCSYVDMLMLQFYLMATRMKHVTDYLGWTSKVKASISILSLFCFPRDIRERTCLDIIALSKSDYDLTDLVHNLLGCSSNVPPDSISAEQKAALIIYYGRKLDLSKYGAEVKIIKDRMPFDRLGDAIRGVQARDWWKLRHALASLFRGGKYLVEFETAKQKSYYAEALKSVSRSGKLFMKMPGEMTLFPVKHCRWCGQVAVQQFRLCPECEDDPEYPDVHFFCSESCESLCLSEQHIEEHARFEMIKLDLGD